MSAKIAQALHQVMSKVGYVQKTGKNPFHGYKYAGEADLLEKLRPAMLEAGLMLIPSVTDITPIDEHGITRVRMQYTLVHKDGDVWPTPIGAAGEGGDKNKNGVGDKGLYKALTGANKYLLFKLFQIETGDDPERDSREPSNDGPTVVGEPQATKSADELIANINGCVTAEELNAYKMTAAFKGVFAALADAHKNLVKTAGTKRGTELAGKVAA